MKLFVESFRWIVIGTGLVICLIVAKHSGQSEDGYRHLMKALHERNMRICEDFADSTTCYTINRQRVCGKTRDGAAEDAAKWIEKNIPVPTPAKCDGCPPLDKI